MANRIKLLPDHVANQIAAGEVVQRPASVVKELLENAIDAEATRVQLIVKDGGKALVQVVDDGLGMSSSDAGLAFRRHATSKINCADDLFRLQTKGFRGEALASIAAISHVELLTCDQTAELATRIRMAGEDVQLREEAVAPKGTSVSVKNLFFNIPARRNFLKSAKVEFRHVLEEFNRVALAHPGVAFSLVHNGSELHQLPAAPLRQRITHLLGKRMNDRLVPVEEETQIAEIAGFVCKPEFAKKSRGEQYFFVNDRFIKSPYLNHAVATAFEGLLKPDTYPGYFIFLKMPPESLDINIHPTKTEIKFENEQSLYAILRSAVKHSLGQFAIRPVLDFDRDGNLDMPYTFKDKQAVLPKVEVDRNFNPFSEENTPQKGRMRSVQGSAKGWESLYEGLAPEEARETPSENWIVESDARSETLFGEQAEELPRQAGVFQVGRKYIITRIKSGLLIIDQQRAHQRVLYEQFLENLTRREPSSQALLFPVTLDIGPSEGLVLRSIKDSLEGMGFRFGKWTGEEIQLTGLPELITESSARDVLEGLIVQWERHEAEVHFSDGDRIAKALCRTLAVKPGTPLQTASQLALVNDLFGCRESALSPFNQPIHTTLGLEELEKKLN